jgi:hypothetical protein
MRSAVLLVLLSGVAWAQAPGDTARPAAPSQAPPAAFAQPTGPALTKLDPDSIPEQCKALAKEADAPSINRALSARISLASCLADHKLKPLVLCDCQQSVTDIDAATQLPLALLDEVYTAGDPAMKILARQAKGDMMLGLVQRMQNTVPPIGNPTPEAQELRTTRIDMLTPMLVPWQDAAKAAFKEVDIIARANPQLAKNQAVVAAVRSARAKMAPETQPAPQTATR